MKLRTIYNAMACGVVVRDAAGSVVHTNDAARQIMGPALDWIKEPAPAEENNDQAPARAMFIDEHGNELTPWDLAPVRVLRTQRPVRAETMGVRLPGGEEHWNVGDAIPVFGKDGALVEVISSFIDVTERVQAQRERDLAWVDVLGRLARLAEYRDDDTHQHNIRVGVMAMRLAQALGLPGTEVELIGQAAPLHDIGKVGIPDAILLKPGRLTPEEFEQMKQHTLIGGRILGGGQSALIRRAEEIALTHHERWDGAGYPYGLRGAAIPLSGRIVSVVDTFDAMTNRRTYKAAWTAAQAIEEIQRQSGTQFDPEVATAFVERVATQM
jgi:HD-GYP domain-containing protein (c-di-GMP phosphodiesterase class II)